MTRVALIVLAVTLAACGFASDDLGQEENELTEIGPHATNSSVRIVYPDMVPPLGLAYDELADRWAELVEPIGGVPVLELQADPDGGPSAVAQDRRSGVAVDVIVADGSVTLAQLSVVDGAGEDDDVGNVAAVRAFLEAVGLDATDVISRLGVDVDNLHGDDQDVEKRYQGTAATVFYAANEDTVLVGVFGPWDQ